MVAKFAFRLPDRLKVQRGMGKYLLRKWLARALPESQPFEPKRGFTVPVAEWMKERAKHLGPLVARSPGVAQLCKLETVKKLFDHMDSRDRHRMACWQLLFYAVWHRVHIEGGGADLPLMELLEGTS
jgi:asparagine synthase (glutamine-hydrolysing)